MPTKITVIIDTPADAAAFEKDYSDIAELAGKLPELRRAESAKVWPHEDGTPTPKHRTLDLYFDSYDDASAAVTTPAAGAFFQRLGGTGTPFTALFSDVVAA
ncbi:EthD family reductase [Frigoribacterium sp. R86507]|uniref:EthD family reductase n=1 Tax=Frigoribacterium sp. R86507 TaxID=3093850 RepID=UPI0037C89562